jgi:hypothetical protein
MPDTKQHFDAFILEMGTREYEIGWWAPSDWVQRRRHWAFTTAMFILAQESNPE